MKPTGIVVFKNICLIDTGYDDESLNTAGGKNNW
jgi:hypothetical protein